MSVDLQVGVRVLQRVQPVLDRDLPADVLGRAGAVDVGADARRERRRRRRATRRLPPAERELGVALRLLLERDGQHPLVAAGLDEVRRRRCRSVPPTEPAVCTRNIGLPAAPSASARYSSGFMTPSKRSGALPRTTASMSARSCWASSSARQRGLADQPAERHVAARLLWWVWPMPTIAHGWWLIARLPSRMQTRFCCRHGPDVAWPARGRGRRSRIVRGRLDDPDRPVAMIGLAASAPPDGLTAHVVAEAERLDAASAPRG